MFSWLVLTRQLLQWDRLSRNSLFSECPSVEVLWIPHWLLWGRLSWCHMAVFTKPGGIQLIYIYENACVSQEINERLQPWTLFLSLPSYHHWLQVSSNGAALQCCQGAQQAIRQTLQTLCKMEPFTRNTRRISSFKVTLSLSNCSPSMQDLLPENWENRADFLHRAACVGQYNCKLLGWAWRYRMRWWPVADADEELGMSTDTVVGTFSFFVMPRSTVMC